MTSTEDINNGSVFEVVDLIDKSLITDEVSLTSLSTSEEEEKEPDAVKKRFDPPLYRQRYEAVLKIIEQCSFPVKKIIDFGCAECKFLKLLKKLNGVREIVGVDTDAELLADCRSRTSPLFSEYFDPRNSPLDLYLFAGSASDFDPRLRNPDVVTAIELIEHLDEETLAEFSRTVFGIIRPKLAIITTPNQEYNVLFDDFPGPFRHYDHKFEWTRSEFRNWARKSVVDAFPEYSVSFAGVGDPGPDSEDVGYCSQIAVFRRITDNDDNINLELISECSESGELVYEEIVHHVYPFREDNRSFDEKLSDALSYYIRMCSLNSDEWNSGISAKVPLKLLVQFSKVSELTQNIEDLRRVLKDRNWEIVVSNDDEEYVLSPPEEEEEEDDYDDDYDNDDLNNGGGSPLHNGLCNGESENEENWGDY